MPLPKALEGAVGNTTAVPSVNVEVWVYIADGKWSATCPALHGLTVSGMETAGAARTELSGAIGKVANACSVNHKPIPWIENTGFTPPEGAMKRIFQVGQIQPGH